jgi:hypothetical protein
MQTAEWHSIEDVGRKDLHCEELEEGTECKNTEENTVCENSFETIHLIVDLARADLIEELCPNKCIVYDCGPVICTGVVANSIVSDQITGS